MAIDAIYDYMHALFFIYPLFFIYLNMHLGDIKLLYSHYIIHIKPDSLTHFREGVIKHIKERKKYLKNAKKKHTTRNTRRVLVVAIVVLVRPYA